ncbi:MAG TPA: hypothetical protein VFL66_08825 [Gaiellaceae bacterium]|nr:hypothetical protein [Gaiellaceae bacterium]
MGRTQIYLTEAELRLRRAVRATYGRSPLTHDERADAIERSAGIWKDRPFTGGCSRG